MSKIVALLCSVVLSLGENPAGCSWMGRFILTANSPAPRAGGRASKAAPVRRRLPDANKRQDEIHGAPP
jgi:hypothetical protein